LNKNIDTAYHDVLAKPFSSGANLNWHSVKAGDFKPLDSYTLAQKQVSLLSYHTLLFNIKQRVSSLRETGNADNAIWADMLSMAFDENNNIVYSNGSEIVILWGFDYKNAAENFVDPILLATHFQLLNQGTDSNSSTQDLTDEVIPSDSTSYELVNAPRLYDVNKKIIVRSNKVQDKSNQFFRNFWWIFPLLALLLFLLCFNQNWRGYSRLGSNLQAELQRIIPKDPLRRPPLDTTKIIKGDSGLSKVVSNVFNIALKDKSKNFSSFALDLKKAFPDSAYKIIFFDTSTSRLQFQFPDSNRNQLKAKIRSSLDKYDLLIWDESIFSTSKTFNDPSFTIPERTWYLSAVGAPLAWDLTSGKADIIIAVIDDGFDLNNPDLSGKVVKPYNVATRTNSVTSDDVRFHGTHVAGIALGKANNGIGISGVAPDCSFMPIQITNSTEVFTSSDVIDGILYAIKNGADVVNLSLGKYFPDEVTNLSLAQQEELSKTTGKDEEAFWDDLFMYAEKENTTIVIASGNQHILVGLDPMQRSPKSIKVSAVNSRMEATSFSNYGSNATIYAPGEKIYSIVPNGQEKFMDGTSMACPIVSGAIALMKSRKKNLTYEAIIELLKNNSDNVRNLGGSLVIRVDKLVKAII